MLTLTMVGQPKKRRPGFLFVHEVLTTAGLPHVHTTIVALYMKEGMRTSVEAILLVQEHNHPHILLSGNTFCKFPGGRLKPGENGILPLLY
ncbi:DNA mismatch repair protein MSH3 [Artemisia annua]|uniref:DNA mismatch repair protein MSH3 n=1 Tax=Artemisia annua TaxID=35608 RepID=A0A2U1LR29_ARTAN|nr:DNA mismatch repair protein MSH3 [Artemisia annua]